MIASKKHTLPLDKFVFDRALTEWSFALSKDGNGNARIFNTNERLFFLSLIDQVRAMTEIGESRGKLFVVTKRKWLGSKVLTQKNSHSSNLMRILDSFSYYEIQQYCKVFKFNPYANVFIIGMLRKRIRQQFDAGAHGRHMDEAQLYQYADVLNTLVDYIRVQTKTPKFLNAHKNFLRRTTENQKSIRTFFDNLFSAEQSIHLLRMDFAYTKINSHWFENGEALDLSFTYAKKDFAMFTRNLKKKKYRYLDHLIGYLWKLEIGVLKGAQYHVVFCFDGNHVKDVSPIADEIADLWHQFSHGYLGISMNCNLLSSSLKGAGAGFIDASDLDKREKLYNLAIPYLTEMETLLQPKNMGRTLGMSALKL